jgi:hypothetical protein
VIGGGNKSFAYRVKAINVVGDTWNYADPAINEIVSGGFPNVTTVSTNTLPATWVTKPNSPGLLAAVLQAGPQVRLAWQDNATNEDGFVIERRVNGVFVQIGTAPARGGTGNMTFIDTAPVTGATNTYRVAAMNAAGLSPNYSSEASVPVPAMPAAPGNFTAANGPNAGTTRSVILGWLDNSNNETGFTIQRATNAAFTAGLNTVTVAAGTTTLTQTGLVRNRNYYFRIRANNGTFVFSAWVNATPFPILTNP